jgi:hypothetical protein
MPLFVGLGRQLVQAFWLPLPEAARVRLTPSEAPRVRREIAGARRILAAARRSDPGPGRDLLALEALRVWLAATARADVPWSIAKPEPEPEPEPEPSTAEAPARPRLPDADPPAAIAEREAAVRAAAVRLGASALGAPLAVRRGLDHAGRPGPEPPTGPEAFRDLIAACEWMDLLVDARSPRERALRAELAAILGWPRGAVIAGVAVLLLVTSVALAPRNLALGKTVTASSICGATPAPPVGRRPAGRLDRLVDGVTVEGAMSRVEWAHGNYAACTELELHPWITVDLGGDHAIDEVVVYNRADCCWGVDDTPIEIQISGDNRTFVTVASRTQPFTDDFPWRASFATRRGRYVRLYNPVNLPKNLVLAEIEVHGR